MKWLPLITFFCLFSLEAQESARNLEGWSVYSKDPEFKLDKLKQKGVISREEIIYQRKTAPIVLYSYDICLRSIKKTIKPSSELEVEEVQGLCHRSLNFKKNIFLAMYRSQYTEKALLEFRKKMHELFLQK